MLSIPAARTCSALAAKRHWLRWPLPALSAWAAAWALFMALHAFDASPVAAMLAATAAGLAFSLFGTTRTRRLLIAAGFPLSLLASGAAGALPGWAWLLPLALLLLLYPLNAWRDAPLFPTPLHALDALALQAALPPGARVLDAGCGLGHGLRALRRAYPQARLEGVEWSWPLACVTRLRCGFAAVRRADLWAHSWAGYDMVYLFQWPESMPRAVAKALAELAPGSWLASLEFEARDWLPYAQLICPDGRSLWLYLMPLRAREPASHRARSGADANASSGAGMGR